MTSAIVRVPDQHARNAGIHARSHQKRHAVFYFRMVHANVGDDGIANNGGDEHEQHNDSTQLEAVGYDGHDDCYDGGNGVGDHRPELGFVGGVAELDDDGGEEESEGVKASEDPEVRRGAEPCRDTEYATSDF